MSDYEVPEPILNPPYDEPGLHWWIVDGEAPEKRSGRRPSMYHYIEPGRDEGQRGGIQIELKLVNLIRSRVRQWRDEGYPGATRMTIDLLQHWTNPGRKHRLFFAQIEAAETVIFLTEARADLLQGIQVPRDDPPPEALADGYSGFLRYACKMATGAGKTTVMGMLAAWSILNKVGSRGAGAARFSDVVLIVCPNVTIRNRLAELDPEAGEASLYRTRDLVPAGLMSRLTGGKVLAMNWHLLAPQAPTVAGDGARVVKVGVRVTTTETIKIGQKNDTKRGTRWLTRETLLTQIANRQVAVAEGGGDPATATTVKIHSTRRQESDKALVDRLLRSVRGKRNILIMNDEAHHAYRVRIQRPEDWDEWAEDDREEWLSDKDQATVWVEGLDRIAQQRGISRCIDLSATPYFLNRVGQDANRPFPWTVSDFGLIDAIESGLVKIPQLAVRDNTGAAIPGYFNIWQWILEPGRLSAAERGGKRSNPKPEAILKWAHHPIAMLGGLWEDLARQWAAEGSERPPVFILICKNTKLADVIHAWLAEGKNPTGIPPAMLPEFRNTPARVNTIVVHSNVVQETDTGVARNKATQWMRFTLDTVGRLRWPRDSQGRDIMPEGFVDLAKDRAAALQVELRDVLHPPGRDVRCIVSVGMLTEGWDCNTVTHVVGLRPFMSQLLCEQVVGRGLRRASYEIGPDGKLTEEVAKVFGIPFRLVPFKKSGPTPPPVRRNHVHALPERAGFAITFPRVEGYTQAVRNRVTVDWARIPPLQLVPGQIPPDVEMKGLHPTASGRQSLMGPGKLEHASLDAWRRDRRVQALVFDLAGSLTRLYREQPGCDIPAHALFPQLARIVARYVKEKLQVVAPADEKDLFLAPYYGWLVDILLANIRGDVESGEAPEVALIEASRREGSTADVDFWTSRDVREVVRSHVNYVVADTRLWEQSAAYYIDRHPGVEAFVKNAGLGLGIPYFHNGEPHEYVPDFVIRLATPSPRHLILEIKGYDPKKDIKAAAARRWCAAVSALRVYGDWQYAMVEKPENVDAVLNNAVAPGAPGLVKEGEGRPPGIEEGRIT